MSFDSTSSINPVARQTTFLSKTDSDSPLDMAIDMFMGSLDISFFALPIVFQAEGVFFTVGFFVYLIICALMASQCYIELKRLSTSRNSVRHSGTTYVGLMDLINECCQMPESFMHPRAMFIIEFYLKFVTISTLIMLLASNQAFVTIVMKHLLTTLIFGELGTTHMAQEQLIARQLPLAVILIFLWVLVPLVRMENNASMSLRMKLSAFFMLLMCSVLFKLLLAGGNFNPPKFINWDIDSTYGFLVSYLIIPLLQIAEDRKDYTLQTSRSPENSAVAFNYFCGISSSVRLLFGFIMAFTVAANQRDIFVLDPFQMLMVCIFTATSVGTKLSAYLDKFTGSVAMSVVLPAVISVIMVFSCESHDTKLINLVANYIAVFFAYQFLVIIPFGLFYLKSCQMTEEGSDPFFSSGAPAGDSDEILQPDQP